ncbi:TPA: hypothetical protein HA318_05415 [Candidatus Micrarchaeota archaeon]|nr:MAG: hypothetical protein AUJ65_02665 [Candidatus Micrarchaeota archaeon CG1_02_51_15]HII39410.1 hypothetical protein [Candidatus Micrarchaeota archaeon]
MLKSRRGAEWAPLYLLVVTVIAAVLLVTVLKPILRRAAAQAGETTAEAQDIARAAIFIGQLLF